ncbi:centromere-associated protein E isoform X2 [Hemicordylus capensis]|uniref:centromere-associated protein E isoform X2 n=1 Tax=Hemicordylus capensis TaxID=884348 RepID=UPI00230422BA|nr:centromere-associated protein E isoform X2 [Hemicordylus capensis]
MAEEGAVTVCVRVRPLIARENADNDKGTISWRSENCNISQVDGTKSFTFDRVFHSEDSTAEVYKGVAGPIINSAVQGYNGTIFAYGQTASGKTYTMLGTKDSPGILPMAIDDVFRTIYSIPDREFLLRISYMEIHNETIQDLLCSNIRKKKPLMVREDINRTIYVEDLSEEVVVAPEQVLSWLQKGEKNRHYGETKMNERSSRSHTIFRMIIESKEKTDASSSSCEGAVMVSHLNLVDLAGSERASQTGTEGLRLKEGCNINRSLFILGQVIKKLCDDQSGGFINYRDSKLTRILQNSLGGNAKTVIICTVTPVSLEETLSTLQFASTAKKMKNSPKVNEVLDDNALLKRYRKEIEDLKRHLEELSSHFHTREVEKDHLAQLLEEKDLLQKQQQDSIRALTEMLVTSSSCLQQEFKARKKRRVTWAPGGVSFLQDLPGRAKKFKTSLSVLPDMEESVSSLFSESDDLGMAACALIPEDEWIPGADISIVHKGFADSVQLCETLVEERDTAVTEWQTVKAKLDSEQLEKEQLAYELRELKEKISTDEFLTLEKETKQEQEMQLMHEISSLKAIIANAEVYNQDLQEDIKGKDMQLKEQEDKIKALEEHVSELKNFVEELKTETGKTDASFSMSFQETSNKVTDEIQQMKRSLADAEAVALDAKRESSFLRSENLVLKEKMKELLDTYNQMEKDVLCYRSQLEAGKTSNKNMQSDLQKELQYYLQENAKLISLLEGKVPKDLLSCVELEGKIKDLTNELNKTLEENTALRKEVTTLSAAGLESDLETLQKEILEKSEMIASLTSERETLLSQVSEKEGLLNEMTEALTSKEEALRENDAASQELKHQFDELEQKFLMDSEENMQRKSQIDLLLDENVKLNATIGILREEMQEKDLEQERFLNMEEQLGQAHQKLSEMEKLKDELKALELKMEAGETENLALAQRLQDGKEEIRALTEERDDLKWKQEALEREKEQMKEDIQETVSLNIEAQEELRNAQNSLQQYLNHIEELKQAILEREAQISSAKESLGIIEEQKLQLASKIQELQMQITEEDELNRRKLSQVQENLGEIEQLREQLQASKTQIEAEMMDKKAIAQKLHEHEEVIKTLIQEKNDLKHRQEVLQKEKDHIKEEMQVAQSMMQDQGGDQEELLLKIKEQFREAQEKLSSLEHLEGQLKDRESELEAEKREKLEMTQRLHESEEERKSLTQGKNDLEQERDSLHLEREALKKEVEKITSKMQGQDGEQEELLLKMKEQLHKAQEKLSSLEHLEGQLKDRESELEAEKREKLEMTQRLHESEEERKSLTQERNDLEQARDSLQSEREAHKKEVEEITSKVKQLEEKSLDLQQLLELREQQSLQAAERQNEVEQRIVKNESKMEAMQKEQEELLQKLHSTEEDFRAVTQEREKLETTVEVLQAERSNMSQTLHRLGETVEKAVAANLQLQTQLQNANCSLGERNKMVEELKQQIADKDSQASKLEEKLGQTAVQRKQEAEDSQEERQKLLATLKHHEEQADRQKDLIAEKDELLQKLEAKLVEETMQLRDKLEKLTEELSVQASEKNLLLAEQRAQALNLQQLAKEKALLQKEKDDLQLTVESIRAENDQLRDNLDENTEKFSETNAKQECALDELREQLKAIQEKLPEGKDDHHRERLEGKVLKIKEILKKFPVLEKRSEYLERVSLNVKSDLNGPKELVAKGLVDLCREEAKTIRRLQMEHELISNRLHRLLNKLQYYYSRLYKKKSEYYVNISNYTMELLDERKKQEELLTQIQSLKKPDLEQHGAVSEQLDILEMSQNLDSYIEQVLKDASEAEEELLGIEMTLQQMESDGKEAKQYFDQCSVRFDLQAFEAGIKQDNERLLSVGRLLKPKSQVFIQAKSELESKNADYCRETEAALKTCKERTRELLQKLNSLKEQQTPCGIANLALEEENYKLGNELKASQQGIKALKLKIQELENVANEALRNLQEKEKRIAMLENELKVRASKSEIVQLKTTLEEKENCLRSALVEKQTLKAHLEKGAELFKEEIEDLKTQLAKADMARMKQSKYFDQEMANANAVAEHREEQLRKLREELRRMQQEQDVTVITTDKDISRPSLPITCGGGSGIVQNTQILMLKSEQAKLEKELCQLKKQYELVLKNEHILKEEVKKWKERALKRREQSSTDDQRLKSPRKTAPPTLAVAPSSPSKGCYLQPALPLETPPPLALNYPTNFFDNSHLGTFPDTRTAQPTSSEQGLKHWIETTGTADKDVSQCKPQ